MNTSNKNNPTPNLKSSLIPICFIPFNNKENVCNFCREKYSMSILYRQSYCKNCLFNYAKDILSNNNISTELIFKKIINVHLNVRIYDINESYKINFRSQDIQEWFNKFSKILYFKQVVTNYSFYSIKNNSIKNIKEQETSCKLCKKLIYQHHYEFRLCSNCYQISSGWVESILTKKSLLILYLPWWDAYDKCVVCKINLKFISDCQKLCLICYLIYTGCRFCLTTNIIFGITDKSQCIKCKRNSSITIDIATFNSDDVYIEEFLISTRLNINVNNHNQILIYMNNINKIDDSYSPLEVYNFIENNLKSIYSKPIIKWIPYSQIIDIEKIAAGGFGVIYKATLLDGSKYQHDDDFLSNRNENKTVAIKRFLNSQNMSRYFLNELNSLHQCYNNTDRIIKYFGITKDPETKEYMLIINYAPGGDLHNYLQKHFISITWNKKLYVLWQISDGLESIHENNFIHRDFHSGNILLEIESIGKWQIGDLGLSQPADSTSSNNEIYGVIPYIAPEIFIGASFSKKSDIYSMGMIMWELTTGCKPFSNVEHDINLIYEIIDGKRPEITDDTPECFSDLMKNCWNSDPLKRPSAKRILEIIYEWTFLQKNWEQFNQAEGKRLELIESKKLGPEISHSKAIYTSRPLSFFISNLSSQGYISKEYKYDKNGIQSLSSQNIKSSQHPNTIYTSRLIPRIHNIEYEAQYGKKVKTNNLNSESDDKKKQ